MLGATAPNTGARSLDCGSTFHPLMKAQRNVAEDSGKEGTVPASFSATDCLRISVTFKLQSKKCPYPGRVCHKGMFTTDFTATALNEGELGSLDF